MHVFRRASMDFHRIANRRPRGESTRNCAPFSYTSLYGVINCQILNCPGSSNGGLPREIASWRSTANRVRLPPEYSIYCALVISDTSILKVHNIRISRLCISVYLLKRVFATKFKLALHYKPWEKATIPTNHYSVWSQPVSPGDRQSISSLCRLRCRDP